MKILVTGCTGYIGSSLVDYLVKKGHKIYCISKSNICPFRENVEHLKYDFLEKFPNYKDLPANLDCIIHLAATMDKSLKNFDMFLVNTVSVLNLLEYGKIIGIKKFIFTSSGAIHGYSKKPLRENSIANPINFYGLTKYQSELLINYYSQQFSTIILRLFFPYGKGQTKGIIPLLTNRIRKREKIIIYNNNNPMINPIYIKVVVKSIYKSLLLEGRNVINICGNEVISIKDLSMLIGKYLGMEPLFKYEIDKKIINLIGDNSRMRNILGIDSTILIKDGIKIYLNMESV